MSKTSDRPAWERDAEQEAPMPYRLPPARPPMPSQKVKVGCWPTLPLVLLSLALLGSSMAGALERSTSN